MPGHMAATPDQELFAAWPSSYVQKRSGARIDTSAVIEANCRARPCHLLQPHTSAEVRGIYINEGVGAEPRATLNSVFAEHQVVSASQCGLTGTRAASRFCGENPEGGSS